MSNVDPTLYERVPDHAIGLTDRGREQAVAAGLRVRTLLAGEPVAAYLSPYRRIHETYSALGLGDLVRSAAEEPRLREQDWGNFQDVADIAGQQVLRDRYGHFFYRFTHGESGADVYDRASSFLETLHRHFERPSYPPNVLLLTHGLMMRLFCMRWFHWTVAEFEALANPDNGEDRVLLREQDGRYALDRPFRRWR